MSPSPAPNPDSVLKVGAQTEPGKLAGAISGQVRERGHAEIQAIGAGAVNQLVKAVAVARSYFAPAGDDLAMYPSFLDMPIGDEIRTVIRVRVEKKAR